MKLHYYAAISLIRREMIRLMRVWTQTLLPSPISIGLYMLIFGKLMGAHIGSMGGLSYLDFLLPGLLMMGIVSNAYSNVATSFFLSKYSRNVEEMLVSPMSPWVILLGYLAGGIIRGILVFLLIFAVAFLFMTPTVLHPWLLAWAVFFTAFLLSCAGFINGVLAESFDDIGLVPTFILTPLTYLGGVFYALEVLPPVARVLTYGNPMFYLVNAFRYSMLGVADISILTVMGAMGALGIGLFGIAAWLIHTGRGLKS